MLFGKTPPVLYFILFILIFISCQKPKSDEEPNTAADNHLHFKISGIQEMENVEYKSSSRNTSASSSSVRQTKVIAQSEIVSLGDDLDAIMTISELPPSQASTYQDKRSIVNNDHKSMSGSKKMARVISSLTNGTHYKIVLFKVDANNNPTDFVQQVEGIVGSAAVSIPVYRNTKYRWYAYSYNNKSQMEPFNSSQTTLSVAPSADDPYKRQDFGYATGLITTGDEIGGSSNINNIVLTRKSSRIILEINSRGMFGAINYASPSFQNNSGLVKADFRLRDSSFINPVNIINPYNVYSHHNSGFSVPVGTDSVPEKDWKRRHTFYTSATGTETTLQVSLDTLWVMSERLQETGGPKDFRNREFLNRTFTFPKFKPMPGKSYFISIKLVESAITIGSTSWARGNVYRNANSGVNNEGFWEYRFRYDNPLYESTNAVPHLTDMFTNDIYNIGGKNICERIYPEGVWDLPTRADFESLDAYSGKRIITENNGWFLLISPPIPALGSPSYPNGNLNFVPVGYKHSAQSAFSEYFPNNILYRLTKGYWRTKEPSYFLQINYSTFQSSFMAIGNYTSTRNACIRCVRKKS